LRRGADRRVRGHGCTSYRAVIAGWAEQIEAIEDAGWVLTYWSVSTDSKGRPEAYPLFELPDED